MSFDEAGIDFVSDVEVIGKNIQADGDSGLDRLDNKLAQSPFHGGDGFGSGFLMDNYFAYH